MKDVKSLNFKDVCRRLLRAESEDEVQEIIDSVPAMRDAKNWFPLDGRDTNFNVTSNQASDGGKALTELMTNMVDAVLTRHAYEKGINPKGPNAPETMYDAVDKLIKNLRGGKLVNLDPRDPWLKDFASKNLVIGITGARTKRQGYPCYTFVDNGEGQAPNNFPTTFLSLSSGNKRDIKFVQGKYNMGSSGVLGYCGRKGFKLIVSRRYDGKQPWGWTLIRRRPNDGNEMPVADYFAIGKPDVLPQFEQDIVFPFATGAGKQYDGSTLKTGTIVKLFDYNVGRGFMSFRGAREALNENLVETILPFRLLDFRQTPDKKRGGDRAEGIDPRPFYGLEYLLLRSHREEGLEPDEEEDAGAVDDRIHVANFTDPDLGTISIGAIPLKPVHTQPEWLKKSNNRVFHAVNGQVHFKQTKGFLSTTCKLPALKDRLIIIIDASQIKFGAHNEVWKGDREHIRNTILGERYKEVVAAAIRESDSLRKLQNKIAEEELKRATSAESNDLFQKLVDADPTLAGLLSNRDPQIRLPSAGGKNGSDAGKGDFTGKKSPTYLRLEDKAATIDIPINRTRPVGCRTDVENGYLQRNDIRGRVLVDEAVRTKFGVRENLQDGRLTIYFEPIDEHVAVGDTFTLRLGLKDDAIPAPVQTAELTIRIAEAAKPATKKDKDKTEKKAGPGGKSGGSGEEKAPTHGLPKCILLTREGEDVKGYATEAWPEGFSQEDGGLIQDLGDDGVIYKINYHNSYHLKYRDGQRGQVSKDVVTEKYILGMRILMLGFEQAYRVMKEIAPDKEALGESIEHVRRMAARGAASTVLALAENLPKIIDKTTVTSEDE